MKINLVLDTEKHPEIADLIEIKMPECAGDPPLISAKDFDLGIPVTNLVIDYTDLD